MTIFSPPTLQLLAAMKKEQKVVLPNPTLDNESVRYEHRFAPFANLLTPPLMPYGCVQRIGTKYLKEYCKCFLPFSFRQYMEIYSLTCQTNSCELFVLAAKVRGRNKCPTYFGSPKSMLPFPFP